MSFPCPECQGHEYSPGNYGGRYANAPLTLTEALARSSNMVMMQVVRRMNLLSVLPVIAALGLPAPTNFNTMALGWDMSPLALCTAMTALPNGGAAVRPRYVVRRVTGGRTEEVPPVRTRQMLDLSVCNFVIEAMRACLTRGTGRVASDLSSYMAGKTGSSDSAWAVLCGPRLTAALWIGRRDTNHDIGYTGGALAMPLLADAMRRLRRSRTDLFPAWGE
jgi:membrane peptidoglycan carboxypeptidase